MEKNIFKSRMGRGRIYALITAAIIIVLFALNLLLTYFGLHRTIFIDMTPEGFYTLTDAMKKECEFVEDLDSEVKITFCADPDTLVAAENTRLIYFMATELDNLYDNLEMECVNVTYNPTAVAKYKSTSLTKITPTDVIISYGDRYRIIKADAFWTSVDGEFWSFNGEYKLASIIRSVTAKDRPTAYFVTGHGETVYDSNNKESAGSIATEELKNLLADRGIGVSTLSLSGDGDIPDDCVLLIINNPRSDYTSDDPDKDKFGYVSQTEKIDRYLVKNHGSVMVSLDYAIVDEQLPVLSSFLYEWGFDLGSSRVNVSADSGDALNSDKTIFSALYDTDTESYGYGIYGEFVDLSSAPRVVMSNTGYVGCSFGTGTSIPEPGTYSITRNYAPFLLASDGAEAKKWNPDSEDFVDLEKTAGKVPALVAVTTRLELDTHQAEYTYSYVMCANSADFFANDYIGNPSYANYDVISALVENMVRMDDYASIELGGISLNSPNLGGKPYVDTDLYSTSDVAADTEYKLVSETAKAWCFVLVMIAPAAIAVLGIVVMVKRKFL